MIEAISDLRFWAILAGFGVASLLLVLWGIKLGLQMAVDDTIGFGVFQAYGRPWKCIPMDGRSTRHHITKGL